jgi:hypothetical protein
VSGDLRIATSPLCRTKFSKVSTLLNLLHEMCSIYNMKWQLCWLLTNFTCKQWPQHRPCTS